MQTNKPLSKQNWKERAAHYGRKILKVAKNNALFGVIVILTTFNLYNLALFWDRAKEPRKIPVLTGDQEARESLPRTAFAPNKSEQILAADPDNRFKLEPQSPERIFYNRIPKCGSRTIRLLVAQPLAAQLGFNFDTSPIYWAYNMDENEQKTFVEEFQQKAPPLFYDRHLHFIDFTKFGTSNPAYINVVRDPLNQAISSYYFSNYTRLGNLSFDDCVATKHDTCVGYMRYKRGILPFFCGQDPICNSSSEESYEKAKENIRNYFPIVGLLEYLDEFFQLAEYILPGYFKGALQQYKTSQEQDKTAQFETQHKDKISPETTQICNEVYKYDILLYNFIKERFFNTYEAFKTTILAQQPEPPPAPAA